MRDRFRVAARRAKYTLGAGLLDLLVRHTSLLDGDTPPAFMNFAGGGDFTEIGAHQSRLLQQRAGLASGDSVLDVGCGIGRLAVALQRDVPGLGYAGFDPVRYGISWCDKRFRDEADYRFTHVDLANAFYNPRGRLDPDSFAFPYPDRSFDVIVATSVFTHIRLAAAGHYLKEMSRCLRPGGRVYATAFLIDEGSRDDMAAGRSALRFTPFAGPEWTTSGDQAEEAVAFEAGSWDAAIARAGLTPDAFFPGAWRGRDDDDYQDAWLLRRLETPHET